MKISLFRILYYALLLPVVLFSSFLLHAEEYRYNITVLNKWAFDKTDEPIVFSLKDLPVSFLVKSVTIYDGNQEIPSQLDDLDKDGIPEELVFVLDIPAKSERNLQISLSSEKTEKIYPSRVYAEMLLRGDKGKHQPINSLTIPGNSDIYNLLHHHGSAFESELVAYRIYFDKKQTVDIYGKFNKQLEIEESQFYPTDEQLARGFGDDVLRVSGSCGLGALKGWNGQKAIHIEPVVSRTESVLATGPVRTVVDVAVKGWEYQGTLLDMTSRYILYAGHRDCEVQVSYGRSLDKQVFAVGIQNIKESVSYSDKKGVLACWGTDWPVNDTIKYAKETVGLALSLPQDIVIEEKADGTNYLYTISAEGQKSFTYYINFTSMKETFGYKTPEEWFAYIKKWNEELKQPIEIQITNSIH